MNKKVLVLGFTLLCFAISLWAKPILVGSNKEIYQNLGQLKPGDTLFLKDGIYKDLQLIVRNSGTLEKPIVIAAKNGGKVFFTGDIKVELRGEHLVLKDIYFKDGNRDITKWSSHGPGLVAIYGSYNRVTGCVFNAFDQANSAYITISIPENGKVPKYCRIDHCVFTDKITFDQVINLNNRPRADKESKVLGEAMYHRIDHCFFSNPQKPGNAGGGIRIGYYRNDIGRCLVDSNLFVRQDSEAEIVTSKSQENIYYGNTFLNCQVTINFRHVDKQLALNNFFISSDDKYGYGGMFVWGSQHIIANNYFNLKKTIKARGNAALYLNPGPEASEHALAFNSLIVNNFFDNNSGYDINFQPLLERRKEFAKESGLEFKLPYNISVKGNLFVSRKQEKHEVFLGSLHKIYFQNNFSSGISSSNPDLFQELKTDKTSYLPQDYEGYKLTQVNNIKNIEGIAIAIQETINQGIKGKPLTWDNVRPSWLAEIPGSYAKNGVLDQQTKEKFQQVIAREKETKK
ncbi:chondroitinase-B domain-containing protein [Pseudopedobacter sp.]|uniref:chondroitinase-B domain-containing protein n=1 Tax=Pseudopedobacter sp. TaxID=1936787 RepID=UPI003342A00E